jgi:drug/metabolite transporter (DMT)-like permease
LIAGEKHVDSSVAAIVTTVPLLIALLALRFDHTERPTRTRVVGMLIGLGGYINPVIAVTLCVLVLGESPGAGAIAGLLTILAGSWLATDDRLRPNPTAIVTRLRGGREPSVAESSVPVRAV